MNVDEFDQFQDDPPPGEPLEDTVTEEEMNAYALERVRKLYPDGNIPGLTKPQPQAQPDPPAYTYLDDEEAEGPLLQKLEQRLSEKQQLIQAMVADACAKAPLTPANQQLFAQQLNTQPLDGLQALRSSGGYMTLAEAFVGKQYIAGEMGQQQPVGVAGSPVNAGGGQARFIPQTTEQRQIVDECTKHFGHLYKNKAELEAEFIKGFGGQ